ncbi:MAG: redoxin family protein, partial [Pseudomonadales bacterium]|nr:redoxin family protein [Pseudomonadales bacterium]
MALTPSNMLPLGTQAPAFDLLATDGARVSLSQFTSRRALLVAFICNHCPFVKHLRGGLAQLARDYQHQDFAMVAINSNDTIAYPADDLTHMREEAVIAGYIFHYLLDETQ